MSDPTTALTLAALLGTALAAGVFFAFSSFVMQGLDDAPTPAAVAAMQGINRKALTPVFMGALFGAALLCLALAALALANFENAPHRFALAGALLYLVGTISVTMRCNVPLNQALEGVDANGAGAAAAWRHYLTSWQRWNHLRTATSAAATAALAAALLSA